MQRKHKILSLFVTVLLIASFLFALIPIVSATTLFSDGYESGNFTAWTATNGSPTVENTIVHTGTYAMNSTGSAVYSRQGYTGALDVFSRAYFYFVTAPASSVSVIYTYDGSYANLWGAGIRVTAGPTYQWSINSNYSASFTFQTGHWYCVEIERVNGTAGNSLLKLWVDGSNVLTDTSQTVVNFCAKSYFGEVSTSNNFTMYTDDCVVATSYIGTTGDSIAPTYSTPATNTTVAGAVCNFTISLADETALANYTFGCNITGTMTNETLFTIPSTPTAYLANVTKTLPSQVGYVVAWEVWEADASNNLNNTGLLYITITAASAWTKTYLGGNTQSTLSTWLGVSTNSISPFGAP